MRVSACDWAWRSHAVLLFMCAVTAMALVEFRHLKTDADYFGQNIAPSVKVVHRVSFGHAGNAPGSKFSI